MKQLVTLVSEMENLLETAGIEPRKAPAKVWEDFAGRTPEQQHAVLTNLAAYLKIIKAVADQEHDALRDKRLTWHAIKELNLLPPQNLFEKIDDDDFVEIYNPQGIQVYRNFEFYKIVSYTLAEICVYRWDQLYHRDQSITDLIIKEGFQRGFSGVRETYKLNIPRHHVKEVFGERNCRYTASFGHLSPLVHKETNEVTHILSTCKIWLIDPSRVGYDEKKGA